MILGSAAQQKIKQSTHHHLVISNHHFVYSIVMSCCDAHGNEQPGEDCDKHCSVQKLERLVRAQHTIAELQQQLESHQQAAQHVKLRLTSELESIKAERSSGQSAMVQLQHQMSQLQHQLQQEVANAEQAQQRLEDLQTRKVCC